MAMVEMVYTHVSCISGHTFEPKEMKFMISLNLICCSHCSLSTLLTHVASMAAGHLVTTSPKAGMKSTIVHSYTVLRFCFLVFREFCHFLNSLRINSFAVVPFQSQTLLFVPKNSDTMFHQCCAPSNWSVLLFTKASFIYSIRLLTHHVNHA